METLTTTNATIDTYKLMFDYNCNPCYKTNEHFSSCDKSYFFSASKFYTIFRFTLKHNMGLSRTIRIATTWAKANSRKKNTFE